jgi:gamma-glutamyltranspeptidase/glutathione hydrolase
MQRRLSALTVLVVAAVASSGLAPAVAAPPIKHPVAQGTGGAVVSDTAESTRAGIDILKAGGTAADAAVAVGSTLGVTDPYVAGLGGGGYLVYYNARSHKVETIDGRETTPRKAGEKLFIDPKTGKPLPFDDAVNSGLSVGTPGMLATWQRALRKWGHLSLAKTLAPAEKVARDGFTVDATFADQTRQNAKRFAQFTSTAKLFLPNGKPPVVGSTFRNPDLARTYAQIRRGGVDAFYRGPVGNDIVRTVRDLPLAPDATIPNRTGKLSRSDLADYRTRDQRPTHVNYRGLDVYGMAPSSSGGITVGEALNILETSKLSTMDKVQRLHRYLEASRLAFADRNRYIGDSRYVSVPQKQLLSQSYADSRACLIDPKHAAPGPVAPGDPRHPAKCKQAKGTALPHEGMHTNHFVITDKWGNVVSYTNTIEQLGGSGITVPGRGFLLNNELTDFNFAPTQGDAPDPNLPAPGKRPRSSMSPTIVLQHGKPFLAVGSPGGASIITTVLQVLLNRLDFGMTLPQAIAAPRASQRNAATTQAEQEFVDMPAARGLEALGHKFVVAPTPDQSNAPATIGVADGLEFLKNGQVLAAGEPVRRGGSAAAVVHPG